MMKEEPSSTIADADRHRISRLDVCKVLMILLSNVACVHLCDISPIFLDLQQIAGATKGSVAVLLIFYRGTGIIAFLLAAPLLSCTGYRHMLSVSLWLMGAATVAVPLATNIGLMSTVFCAYGFGRALFSLVGTKICAMLGKEKYGFLFIHLYYVGSSAGYSLGAAVTKPFLSRHLFNTTLVEQRCQAEGIQDIAVCKDIHLSEFYTPSHLYIPYSIFGGLTLACAVVFHILESKNLSQNLDSSKETNKHGRLNVQKYSKLWVSYISLLGLIGIVCAANFGIAATNKVLLVVELVNTDAQVPKMDAVTLAVVYFVSMAIARILLIPVSRYVSSYLIAVIGTATYLTSSCLSWLLYQYGLPIYWLYSILTGASEGMIGPPLVAYICLEFPDSLAYLAALEVGYGTAQLIFPPAIIWIQNIRFIRDFFIVNAATAFLSLTSLLVLSYFIKSFKRYTERAELAHVDGARARLLKAVNETQEKIRLTEQSVRYLTNGSG